MGHTRYLGYNTESLKRIVYCCPTGVFYYTVHYTVDFTTRPFIKYPVGLLFLICSEILGNILLHRGFSLHDGILLHDGISEQPFTKYPVGLFFLICSEILICMYYTYQEMSDISRNE